MNSAYTSVRAQTDSQFRCYEGNYQYGQYALRVGDSCPPDTEYDSTIGECKTPPPPCEVGDPGIFASGDGPVITSGGRNYVVNPPMGDSVCYNQCRFDLKSSATSCFRVSGTTDRGFCNYLGTGNGQSCSEPDAALGRTGPELNTPDTPDVPPSDPNDPGCPDGYSWSGTTCVKTPADDGGSGDGDGDGNGNGSGDGDNDGGSGGGSGNGGGSGDGGSGSGGGGSGSGGSTGGGSGSGDGDGGSGGGGSGDGDGDEGGVAGPTRSLVAPEPGSFAEGIAEWDKKIATVRAELEQKIDQYSSLFSGAFDLNLGQSGGHLPCHTFSVYGQTAKLCLSDYEDSLINLRYVLLLVAAVVAGLIILKD